MKALVVAAAALLLVSGQALACKPIGFGKFKVGQRVTGAQFAGIAGTCERTECRYNARSGIEYVVIGGVVREVSAPVRLVGGLPAPAGRIDATYARRASRNRCQPFALKRDDGGQGYLETAERVDRASGQPVRTTIYRDERGLPLVAITSLPTN